MNEQRKVTEEAVADLMSRYRFERCPEFTAQDRDGKPGRKCMVLTNNKDPSKQRYVEWAAHSGRGG